MSKTLAALAKKNPDKVRGWYKDSDGYWVDLKRGWQLWECHSVHEWKVRDLLASFKGVEPCDCDDCKKL